MKGNQRVIDELNKRLTEELSCINQYMVHSEMCENWGYERLHKSIEKRAFTEMRHAEKLIQRILFLEGIPIVSKLNDIHIGSDVAKMHQNDSAMESLAVKNYNQSIRIAMDENDNGTRDFLNSILKEEEEHLDEIEAQLDEISQMSIQNYLVQQVVG